MAKTAKTAKYPVEFGSVSFGKLTARIGVKVDREHLNLADAEKLLCGARLSVKLVLGDGSPAVLPEVIPSIENAGDCKGISVKTDSIGFGLTFMCEGLDSLSLVKMSNSSGVVELERIGDLDDDTVDED